MEPSVLSLRRAPMVALVPGKMYIVGHDSTGKTSRGRMVNYTKNIQGSPTATIDLREDKHRDKALWGDFISIGTAMPQMPLDDFPFYPVGVNMIHLQAIPPDG